MRALVVAAVSLAGATLVAGPIAYLRTQRQIPKEQPGLTADTNLPTGPSLESQVSRQLADSVRITGELVHAEQIKALQPAAGSRVVTKPAERQRAIPPPARKSLLARVIFGTSGHRPSPFPHPGS